MFRTDRSLAASLVAALVLAGTPLAAAPAKAKPQPIVGTLQKVDGQTLTVATAKGTETIVLGPHARIRHGSKTITASDLSSDAGARVKVRFSEVNGHKEAESVAVWFPRKSSRTTRASPPSRGSAPAAKK